MTCISIIPSPRGTFSVVGLLAALGALCLLSTTQARADEDRAALARNKALAVGFIDTLFNRHDARAAYEKYASPRFHHHAQWAGPGTPEEIVAHDIEAGARMSNGGKSKREIKQVVAEGDLVVVHSQASGNADDGQEIQNPKKGNQKGPKTGEEIVDIFRVENGKLAEHWEVSQPTTDLTDVY